MKRFKRVEPTIVQQFGQRYSRTGVVKHFETDDGIVHEFTTVGREIDRAGAVVALTPDHKVVTTYQFRPGPERWMYELPGGGINDGEDPQAGALRELREETGYAPGTVTYLGESCGDAYRNTTWYYYLATDCTAMEAGTELDVEEEEQGAEVRLISITELIDNAKTSQMTDPRAVLMAYETLKELEENS